jgi:hypothetical protein
MQGVLTQVVLTNLPDDPLDSLLFPFCCFVLVMLSKDSGV